MSLDVISAMKQQKTQAETKPTTVPFYFRLNDKQRALVRPLVNLDGAYKTLFHHFFDQAQKFYVDAVCAKMAGKTCHYCEQARLAEDKKRQKDMAARETFMLPIHVHAVLGQRIDPDTKMPVLDANDNPIWERLTYTDRETGEERQVSGLRVIQLTFFGSIGTIADTFLKVYEGGESIAARDFVIERQGGDQHTRYIVSKRQPAPFTGKVELGTTEQIKARVWEISPMQALDDDGHEDGAPEF